MREIQRQAKLGRDIVRINERIDITAGELNQIRDSFISDNKDKGFNEALFNVICNSFYFGVNAGYKQRGREVV